MLWCRERPQRAQYSSVLCAVLCLSDHPCRSVCCSQAFRVIAEALRSAGFVGTIPQYLDIIATAWKGERQHVELVSAVFDYTSWVKGLVWETNFKKDATANVLRQINQNRYFKLLRRQVDGAVCLW